MNKVSFEMAEQNEIVADPISSDGSGESWILLDEMDEAMNEEFNISQASTESQSDSVDKSTSFETLTQSNLGMVDEAVPTISVTEDIVKGDSNVGTIPSEVCSSNDEDDDDINDIEHSRR